MKLIEVLLWWLTGVLNTIITSTSFHLAEKELLYSFTTEIARYFRLALKACGADSRQESSLRITIGNLFKCKPYSTIAVCEHDTRHRQKILWVTRDPVISTYMDVATSVVHILQQSHNVTLASNWPSRHVHTSSYSVTRHALGLTVMGTIIFLLQ